MEEQKKRKPTRLQGFDYNNVGAYFITICTQNRRCILSHIVGGDVLDAPPKNVGGDVLDAPPCVALSQYGKIVDKYINQLNDFYDNVEVDSCVIMPNHIHIILFVLENGSSRTSTPTIQHSVVCRFVSTLKRFCNKEIGNNIFQRSFHDHIIRNRDDYEEHVKYICENPMRWQFDELYSEE